MCYLTLFNEIIEKQLNDALIKKEYYKWNNTSIHNLFRILGGNYSDESKRLVFMLLKEYNEYSKNR
jgi:hypothetical protein